MCGQKIHEMIDLIILPLMVLTLKKNDFKSEHDLQVLITNELDILIIMNDEIRCTLLMVKVIETCLP